MKPTLQLKLSQHLTLTPQLQQSIRLLQLSTLELNAEVERLLQENPLLEKAEEEDGGANASAPFSPGLAASAPADAADDGADAPAAEFALAASGSDRTDWGSTTGTGDDEDERFIPQQVATNSL